MNKILQNSILASNLSKTVLYSIEFKLLLGLSKTFSFFVKPPKEEKDKELVKHLQEGVIKLHKEDARNIDEGYYPLDVIKPKSPFMHLRNLPYIIYDSLKISRRRKLNRKKDLEDDLITAPDYLKRNYHFQTDGYFSERSAAIYEHQVEVLFSGTAAPMRRMLIKMIKEKLKTKSSLKILELGAGVGSASLDFSKSFDFEKYVVSDVSAPYLDLAKKRLLSKNKNESRLNFVQTAAEDLPFNENEFDLVFSVYLFHELPKDVREKVLSESHRVLKKDGVFAFCDSLQVNDEPRLNSVLAQFPIDYHEPFYKGYTLWKTKESLEKTGFHEINSDHKLLSKYWLAKKRN